jgi:hypothetical protein
MMRRKAIQYILSLLTVMGTVISLCAQRNPTNTLREYADVLNLASEAAVEAKRAEVTAEKGWEVQIISHNEALPQISGNMTEWLSAQSNMVVFYLPVDVEGKMPGIEVSDDLLDVLPYAIRQDIAYQDMLPYYLAGYYETALIEGMNALLEDKLLLANVTFENSYPIKGVDTPQWKVGSGAASEENIIAGAVCYKRQDVMSLSPEFAFSGILSGTDIKIKAVANEEEYVINGLVAGGNTIQPLGSERIEISTGDVVDYWPSFEVAWSLSFDGGESWEEMSTTKNEVFITWEEPEYGTNETSFFKEIFYYGCNQGIGGTNTENIISLLWSLFEARALNIVHFNPSQNSNPLTYYKKPFPEYSSHEMLFNTMGLPDFDGECGAFARIFLRVLLHQGIDAQLIEVHPIDGREEFFVKKWFIDGIPPSFPDEEYKYLNKVKEEIREFEEEVYDENGQLVIISGTTSHADIRRDNNVYEWIGEPDIIDDPSGIAGQGGIVNPYSDFGRHYLVKADGLIYDPSYGSMFSSIEQWEAQSIDAFFWFTKKIINGESIPVIKIRKNGPEKDME